MFKLFYKKEWLKLDKLLEKQRCENQKLKTLLESYESENKRLNSLTIDLNKQITSLRVNLNVANEKIKVLNGSNGGLVMHKNKLLKKVEQLEEQLKESMSNKYVVRKVPSGRKPNFQKTKVSKVPNAKAQNYIKKELINE